MEDRLYSERIVRYNEQATLPEKSKSLLDRL